MDANELIEFLSKGKDDDELMLMCEAAVEEMGPQAFLDTIAPKATEALVTYEEQLDEIEAAYREMKNDIPDRTIRVGMLAGSLLSLPFAPVDIITCLAILLDRYTDEYDG